MLVYHAQRQAGNCSKEPVDIAHLLMLPADQNVFRAETNNDLGSRSKSSRYMKPVLSNANDAPFIITGFDYRVQAVFNADDASHDFIGRPIASNRRLCLLSLREPRPPELLSLLDARQQKV
ncbi:MAG TPA: hypothetical protein VHM64_07095, partial [Candidatus Binatia bacterium]|nr:hypothetical protein [Candidatus Binatia bacterium]